MELDSVITIIGRAVSQPFLFLTLYHYWHATELRYLYRICFMNYLGSLMVSNFWNIWAILNDYHKTRPTHIYHQYNFIEFSIILWTNVLCFDFWQSIKNLLPYNVNRREQIIYIKYLIYVWSTSIIYTIVGCINDYSIKLRTDQGLYENIRWLSFAYIVIVLLSNALMMIHATVIIIKEIRAIKKLNRCDTAKNENDRKTKLMLYFKLVLVTIFILCSKWFWFRLDDILKTKGTSFMYKCLMAGNSFQGVFIFFLFAFKTKKKRENRTTRTPGLLNDRTKSSELKSQLSASV